LGLQTPPLPRLLRQPQRFQNLLPMFLQQGQFPTLSLTLLSLSTHCLACPSPQTLDELLPSLQTLPQLLKLVKTLVKLGLGLHLPLRLASILVLQRGLAQQGLQGSLEEPCQQTPGLIPGLTPGQSLLSDQLEATQVKPSACWIQVVAYTCSICFNGVVWLLPPIGNACSLMFFGTQSGLVCLHVIMSPVCMHTCSHALIHLLNCVYVCALDHTYICQSFDSH